MSNVKKALAALMFSGKVKIILTLVMFAVIVTFSLGTCGIMASVIEGKETIETSNLDMAVIDSGIMAGVSFVAGFASWMIMTIHLMHMEGFAEQYNAMRVMPVKKSWGIRFCIGRTALIVGAMYIPEALLLALNIAECGVFKAAATLMMLAASIALFSVMYSFALYIKLKSGAGRFASFAALGVLMLSSAIGALKGNWYLLVSAYDNGIAALIVSLAVLAASVLAAVYAAKFTSERLD
ncbi:MAG: hypothetical protein IJZ72_08010 [Oscillospiraceae bacterium]|nr:hypothetical protein [Oscillospiraceae bacterium]